MSYAWEEMAKEDIIDTLLWAAGEDFSPETSMTYERTAKGNIVASFEDWEGKMHRAFVIVMPREISEEEYAEIDWYG